MTARRKTASIMPPIVARPAPSALTKEFSQCRPASRLSSPTSSSPPRSSPQDGLQMARRCDDHGAHADGISLAAPIAPAERSPRSASLNPNADARGWISGAGRSPAFRYRDPQLGDPGLRRRQWKGGFHFPAGNHRTDRLAKRRLDPVRVPQISRD